MSSTEAHKCTCCQALQRKHAAIVAAEVHHICVDEGKWKVDGERYCLMHAPTLDKAEAFAAALEKKLAAKDHDFFGVWFPSEVDLRDHHFKSEACFILAEFAGDAYFNNAYFAGEANFTAARFNGGAEFIGTKFAGETIFKRSYFSGPALFANAV